MADELLTLGEILSVLRGVRGAFWYLLNSGNPIQQAGLQKNLEPLDEIIERIEAQLAKIQPEIDKLKEESEARLEVIRRLTTTIEESIKQERERIKFDVETELLSAGHGGVIIMLNQMRMWQALKEGA